MADRLMADRLTAALRVADRRVVVRPEAAAPVNFPDPMLLWLAQAQA